MSYSENAVGAVRRNKATQRITPANVRGAYPTAAGPPRQHVGLAGKSMQLVRILEAKDRRRSPKETRIRAFEPIIVPLTRVRIDRGRQFIEKSFVMHG
jgi:hypothetical protein